MPGCLAKKVINVALLIAAIALLVPFSVYCSKPSAPEAAFTVSYVSGELLVLQDYIAGTAPLTVKFNDQSTGEITTWKWNFGDGIVIEGKDEDSRNPVHQYITANTGYIVTLTVRGPGGSDDAEEMSLVSVLRCSEGAVSELGQAKAAIQSCLSAAGKTALDSRVTGWNGSRGMVTAGGLDAADYLGVWKTFKATYDVALDGSIINGTDVSWGCVYWDVAGLLGRPGWRANQ